MNFLYFAKETIRYTAMPVAHILDRYCKENGRSELVCAWQKQILLGKEPPQAWVQETERAVEKNGLSNKERQLLLDFGAGFGISDVEGQLSHCNLYEKTVEQVQESAREERAQKGKLSVLLGVLLGLGIDLMLL